MSFRELFGQSDAAVPAVESPCVRICVIEDDGLCVGCARTIDEIARWSRMTAAERESIMANLVERRRSSGD